MKNCCFETFDQAEYRLTAMKLSTDFSIGP